MPVLNLENFSVPGEVKKPQGKVLDLDLFNTERSTSEQPVKKGLDLEAFDKVNQEREEQFGVIKPTPGFVESLSNPLQRAYEIWQRESAEGLQQTTEPGFWNKVIGPLRYFGSPVTGAVEGIFGEPTESGIIAMGGGPEKAKFIRGLVENALYFSSPLKSVAKTLPSAAIAENANITKNINNALKRSKGDQVMKFIRERRGNHDTALAYSQKFIIENLDQKFTKAERESMPYLLQKTRPVEALKKIGREDLIPIIENPSDVMKQGLKKVEDYYNKSYAFMKEHGTAPEYVENYVTQLWDIPKNLKGKVVNYFTTYNPFAQKRFIDTLEKGINEFGLTPKTTDMSELLKIYDNMRIRVAYDKQFADQIANMTDEVGLKLMMPASKAPNNWVTLDHPALKKAVYKGKTKTGEAVINLEAVKVHPDIRYELENVFGKRITGESIPGGTSILNSLETLSAIAKKAAFAGSLFHYMTLGESALGSGKKTAKEALKMWNPKKIYDAVKNKNFDIYKDMALTEDAIKNGGIKFGALSDVQLNKIDHMFEKLETTTKNFPGVNKLVSGVRKANTLWDRALWDYYHNNLKLYAYQDQLTQELKRVKPQTAEEILAIKRGVGDFVNNSFGGQNWEFNKILGNPKIQQIMHLGLLAPDWTISTLKQAAAPISGLIKGDKTQIAVGGKFWLRAAIYNTIIAQAINYANTKKDTGIGKFTWENDPGQELNIFIGYNDDDPTGQTRGSKRYLRPAKQFKEAIEWFNDPIKTLGAKTNPVLREIYKQISERDLGSGYPAEFETTKGIMDLLPRLRSVAENVVPFSLRAYMNKNATKNFMFTWPTSKGMTNYKAIENYKKGIKLVQAYPDKTKGRDVIKRTFISAIENGIDPIKTLQNANQILKTQMGYRYKDLAEDILMEAKGMNPEAQKDLMAIYLKKGILNQKVAEYINRMVNEQRIINTMQQQYKISGNSNSSSNMSK